MVKPLIAGVVLAALSTVTVADQNVVCSRFLKIHATTDDGGYTLRSSHPRVKRAVLRLTRTLSNTDGREAISDFNWHMSWWCRDNPNSGSWEASLFAEKKVM